ncbi:MAG: IscS subfamily cysteine desulfurase [Deltaproteobacteria bacterium]|nr:IscS subfamily cysteine desulfurase [Deltaproteobacteria bacterium]
MKLPIYMDNHATTPVDPRVLEQMLPYFTEKFGNAASRNHSFGWTAEAAVEKAREQVAALIGADPKEIVFTSGATESNNLAVKGSALFLKDKGKHLVTSKIEHKAVLDSCRALEREGFEVTYLDPARDGLIDPAKVQAALRPDTILVSVMFANNEIGTINDVSAIGALCRERGIYFHTDAVQGLGKVPFDVNAVKADLVSITAHKMYGPKGVGALYVRRKPRVRLAPQMDGGGHERGLRSGTLNVPSIVGLGAAAELARLEMPTEMVRIKGMRDRLRARIEAAVPKAVLNGHPEKRLPGNLNLSFAYGEGESMLMALKDVAVSSGSACTSASLEPSYVLRALGIGDDLAHSSIRFGIGRFNTEEEVDFVADLVIRKVAKLRELSPLWEMVQEGIDPNTVQWAAH